MTSIFHLYTVGKITSGEQLGYYIYVIPYESSSVAYLVLTSPTQDFGCNRKSDETVVYDEYVLNLSNLYSLIQYRNWTIEWLDLPEVDDCLPCEYIERHKESLQTIDQLRIKFRG